MKITIIGCGNIGSGIAHILANGHTLALHDRDSKKAGELAKEIGVKSYAKPADAVANSDVVILAVKPQSFNEVSEQISSLLTPKQVLVSILSGITLNTLRKHFKKIPLVRMTSNLPLIYGKGVIALAESSGLTKEAKSSLDKLFSSLGSVHWVPESKIDALTSLIGSGPAFMYVIFEAMVDASVAMGFSPPDGRQFILEMLEGAVTMLKESGQHPGELKWKTTSPAGTTIAGLQILEEAGVRGSIINMFLAAYERTQELGK